MSTKSRRDRQRTGRSAAERQALVEAIEKEHGTGVIRIGKAAPVGEGISTNSLLLDSAIGIGGIPRGRVTEIYGHEGSGKTTVAVHVMANAMNEGGTAAYIDTEHALDPDFAGQCGLDLNDVMLSQPDSAEQALNVALKLVESGQLDVVVLDSVAALVPQAEIDGEIGRQVVALQARLMSQSLRKMTSVIAKQKTAMIFINQVREKIGVTFGSPETTPGGRALKFYASTRIDLRRIGTIKQGELVIGDRIRARVVKNKVARPWRQVEFEILHESGINHIGEVIDLAVRFGNLRKNGSRYYREEQYIANGREACRRALLGVPDTLGQIKTEVLAELATAKDKEKNKVEAESDDQTQTTSPDDDTESTEE